MTWWQAALWGLVGGGLASVTSFVADVVAAGSSWPRRGTGLGDLGPRLFVLAAGLLLGAGVAAAAHEQINGPWPAFVFGVGAPATIRGLAVVAEVLRGTSRSRCQSHRRPRPRRPEGGRSVRTRPDTVLGRLALAVRPPQPWLHIRASGWWYRVLLAAGARPAKVAPRPFPDLRGAGLNGADLRSALLPNVHLDGAHLNDADLTGADLHDADLTGALLGGLLGQWVHVGLRGSRSA